MRATSIYFAGLLTALANITSAYAEDACKVQPLGTLGGRGSTTRDINEQGQIVGLSAIAGSDNPVQAVFHAFVWQNGQMRDLGALAADGQSEATAINDSGVIVGNSSLVRKGKHVPVIWQDETIATLAFDGDDGGAVGINNRGQIIGNAGYSECLLWQDAGSEPIRLRGLGGEFCRATAISDAGVIVGTAKNAAGEERAFVWRNGVMREAESIEHSSGEVSELRDINAMGLAVGRIHSTELPGPAPRGLVWSPQRGGSILATGDTLPRAVNDWGIIALIPTSNPFSLWLGDQDGRTVVLGDGLNGPRVVSREFDSVTGFTFNNHLQAAWSVYITGTEFDHAYTCQLPWSAAIRLARQRAHAR